MTIYRIDFKNTSWEEPAVGIRMKVYRDSDKQIRLVEFSKAFVEPDWCTRGHIGYILDGRLEVSFSDSREVFKAGDGVFIPPGYEHRHKAQVLTDIATLILVEEIQSDCGEYLR